VAIETVGVRDQAIDRGIGHCSIPPESTDASGLVTNAMEVCQALTLTSAPTEDDMHPRKIVINAFLRRGAHVTATQGRKKVYWGGFPTRPNYVLLI
jgi:hypothetical protein